MLVLTRKTDESVLIGDDIKITVLSIESDRVRIGIDAPKNLRVFRYETIKKIVLENQKAVNVNVNLVELTQMKERMTQEADNKGEE